MTRIMAAPSRHHYQRVLRRFRTSKGRWVVAGLGFVLALCWVVATSLRVQPDSSSSGSRRGPQRGGNLAAHEQRHVSVAGHPQGGGGVPNALFGDDGVVPGIAQREDDGGATRGNEEAPSPYCDPARHSNLHDMKELVHRSFEIPLEEYGPVGVRPVIQESVVQAAFEKSLEQLTRERVHDWHHILEGTRVTERPLGGSVLQPPFLALGAGFYCLSVRDEVDGCIVASVPFVVLDPHRHESEYAVAPLALQHRTTRYRDIAQQQQQQAHAADAAPDVNTKRTKADGNGGLFPLRELTFFYSKYFPLRSVAPVVVSIPSVLDDFYRQDDFTASSEYLHTSLVVQERHVSLSGGGGRLPHEEGRASNAPEDIHIDLEYGRGSFWVTTGHAFHRSRMVLAKLDSRLLHAVKASHSAEPVKRAGFEHYAAQRYVLVSPNPEEDEPLVVQDAEAEDDAGGGHQRRQDERQQHGQPLAGRRLASLDKNPNNHDHHRRDDIKEKQKPHLTAQQRRHHRTRNDDGVLAHVDETREHRFAVQFLSMHHLEFVAVPLAKMAAPKTVNDFLAYVHGLGTDEPCTVRLAWTLELREDVRIERECLFAIDDRTQLIVKRGATVVLAGDGPTKPMLWTSTDVTATWGGIVVEDGANLTMRHVMIHKVGSTGIPRVAGTGSHIKRYTPAVTVSPKADAAKGAPAYLVVEDTAVLNCEGSGFALGKGSHTTIVRTIVQDVAQGGECVSCRIRISKSHFIDFPFASNLSLAYVDGDNDAFYFRGGQAEVEHSVFLNALDDGIDSASSTGDPEHSTLTLRHVAVENCQHEGVALSGSKGTRRTVTIEGSLIAATQQGVENGHTPIQHRAVVRNTVFFHNHVALRNGDNYPTLDVFGKVHVAHSLFVHNAIPVLDWVEIDHSRKTNRNTYYDPKMYRYEAHNPHLLLQQKQGMAGGGGAAADFLTPLLTLSNCLIQQYDDGQDDRLAVPAPQNLQSELYVSGFARPHRARADGGAADDAQRKVVASAQWSRRTSSADLRRGVFCGRQHFLVDGTLTSSEDHGTSNIFNGLRR